MPQVKGDEGRVDSGLQQVHCGRVPNEMWRDSLGGKAWTMRNSALYVRVENVGDAIAGEHTSTCIGKREFAGDFSDLIKPDAKGPSGRWPEWNLSIFAAFSLKMQ